jgi:hypothetical protein
MNCPNSCVNFSSLGYSRQYTSTASNFSPVTIVKGLVQLKNQFNFRSLCSWESLGEGSQSTIRSDAMWNV